MNKHAVYEINSESPDVTEKLAEKIGRQLKGGEIIELIGDVGAGKTTFVRGLARGIGSKDRVSSPTFTLSKVYKSAKISLYHYDFYRIDDLAIIKSELKETAAEPKNTVVLEWAEAMQGIFSLAHMQIRLKVKEDESRTLIINMPQEYKYIRLGQ